MNDDQHLPHFDNIAADRIKEHTDRQREDRSDRRAAALNAVDLARQHASRSNEPYSQSEADTIVAIMELLDRIAQE